MKPPDPFRPLVRRRGMLWAAVCTTCRDRMPSQDWSDGWSKAIEHAKSAEHLAAVKDELIRDGINAKTTLRDRFMAAIESGVDPEGDEDTDEATAYETARVRVGEATRALAEFLVATGERSSETALATAIVLIGDATRALESSGLEEAA